MVTSGMRRGLFGSGLALLTLVVGSSAVQADPLLYTITGIAPLPETSQTVPTAINNNGQVVGVSYNTTSYNLATDSWAYYDTGAKPFLSSGGQTSQISRPLNGPPNSINDSGQVVGGNSSINNAGFTMIGESYIANPDGSTKSGFVYVTPSGLQGMSTTSQINNSGLVVGSGSGGVIVFMPPGGTWAEASLIHATAYAGTSGGTFYSGPFNDGSRAVAINDRGEVVAQDTYDAATFVLDKNGHVTNLASLPGSANVLGVAINNSGQVVGSQVSSDYLGALIGASNYNYLKAVLYTNGQIVDLNSLLGPGSGWDLTRATGINDLGQIIGQGTYDGQTMGFVLTPDGAEVPEPGTLALATLAILALVGRARLGRASQPVRGERGASAPCLGDFPI